MDQAGEALATVAPALAFLLVGVPLAALLDELGLFDAVAGLREQRFRDLPVLALWLLAAATTIVLNLDTTIVLLTPLLIRLARRAGADPVPLALVPLLLAAFASSVLPISNLTTLIATEQLGLSVIDVVTHLALPSAAAVVVGWFAYRRLRFGKNGNFGEVGARYFDRFGHIFQAHRILRVRFVDQFGAEHVLAVPLEKIVIFARLERRQRYPCTQK